ncbi:molybdenum cofactor guanylyltransferase [Archaeoglobales archaeon]|nr:MAG: molybdenum cofactor guanylyltransferase [Archaeoglobales archaeon]
MRIAVLIGGRGRRIGKEKAQIVLCGKKLIEIAIRKFSNQDLIFVCRDEDQAREYSKNFDCTFIFDSFKNAGPLGGIHAALKHFKECLITAVDMPFIKKSLANFIFEEGRRLGCDALVPTSRFAEPLLAYYSSSIVGEIEEVLRRGERRILAVLRRVNTIFYPMDKLRKFDKNLISFFNINTVEDLRRAEKLCSEIDLEGR